MTQEVALVEVLARALATAFVVVAITGIAGRLGPRIGGILVGLPIILGPAYAFLLLGHSPAFLAEAAGHTIFALSGSVAFCIAFIQIGGRGLPLAPTLGGAILAWTAVALAARQLPQWPWLGVVLYLLLMTAGVYLARPFVQQLPSLRPERGWGELLLRGVAAGVMVGLVSLLAPLIGPAWSGTILAFPVALFAVSWALFRRYGAGTAIVTLASAQLGMTSLIAFALTVTFLAERLPAIPLFATACAACLVPTVIVTFAGRRRAAN